MIPVFVWVLTCCIVFALQYVQPVVSVLTFFKGSLLLGTVIVTFYVGASINRDITNDYTYIGAPFLMGTVALGGVVNVMPLMYSKISPIKEQIQYFRWAVVMGMLTCTVLNIGWCWAVLDIVPQLQAYHCENDNDTVCYRHISLEQSAVNGEISTIPLTTMINEFYPTFKWVAMLVELFIVVSITVSFLTIGAVLHHTLNGWVKSFWTKDTMATYRDKLKTPKKLSCCNVQCMCNTVLSFVAFGVVFLIAMLDPQGFLDMLEKFASLTINLEVALFIFLMLLKSRNKDNIKLKVILPLPPLVHKLILLLPLYFGFAVVYDVYSTIHDIVIEHSISPGKVITQGVPTGIIKNTSVLLASNMTTITSTHFYNSTTLSAVSTNFSSTSTLTPL